MMGSIKGRLAPLFRIGLHIVFWGWNVLFVAFCAILVIPYFLWPMARLASAGDMPWGIFTFTVAAMGVVAASLLAAARTVALPTKTERSVLLFKLFYGVEIPLIFLIVYRLFFVRVLTPAMGHLLLGVFIAIALFAVYLAWGSRVRGKKFALLTTALWPVALMTVLYAAILISFYAIPLAKHIATGFVSMNWLDLFTGVPSVHAFFILCIGAAITLFTATLFIFSPLVLVTFYIKQMKTGMVENAAVLSWRVYGSIFAASLVIYLGFAWLLNRQNQRDAFALLDKSHYSAEDMNRLPAKEKQLRRDLTDIYLAPYRYLSTKQGNNHIQCLYEDIVGKAGAKHAQTAYNFLASPFLYAEGSFADGKKAEELYERFFDIPIQKAERRRIKAALNATWNRDDAEAGLLNADEKKVFLKRQTVSLNEKNNCAEIELYEHYENRTHQNQEVFYYFTLPDYSVITGLWLGATGDRKKRDRYTISPRGAAQSIYKAQVRRAVDPALLEMVGPNQYRLRAFPVPANRLDRKRSSDTNGELHLWMTYTTLADGNGRFPLPYCIEKRNVFWTKKTRRDYPAAYSAPGRGSWMPGPGAPKPRPDGEPFSVALDDSTNVRFSADKTAWPERPSLAGPVAVLIDNSKSMAANANTVAQTVRELERLASSCNAPLDVFQGGGNSFGKTASPFDPRTIRFFGSSTLPELLDQFRRNSGSTYTMLIVVTDDGGYELGRDTVPRLDMGMPSHIIHCNNSLPPAYGDNLMETLGKHQSLIAGSLPDLLQKLAARQYLRNDPSVIARAGRYAVEMLPGQSAAGGHDELKPLAAKHCIEKAALDRDMSRLANLDYVHSLAKKHSLITRYSSMIVLVNEEQRRQLASAEQGDDRFDREVETGKETLTSPIDVMKVHTVPEPDEWILVLVVAMIAAFAEANRRRNKRAAGAAGRF